MKKYKNLMVAVGIALMSVSVAACTTSEKRTAGYGAGGAALGALAGGAIGGDGRGALIGAAIGAIGGTLVGASQAKNGVEYCKYRDPYGRIYEAPCQ